MRVKVGHGNAALLGPPLDGRSECKNTAIENPFATLLGDQGA
jgi:hypothetical protein